MARTRLTPPTAGRAARLQPPPLPRHPVNSLPAAVREHLHRARGVHLEHPEIYLLPELSLRGSKPIDHNNCIRTPPSQMGWFRVWRSEKI